MSSGARYIQVGRVKRELPTTWDPRFVPSVTSEVMKNYFPRPNTRAGQVVLQHIQWLMQKDALGQDMFLLGTPGPFRRRLVRYYCQIAKRELESLVITADSSEADLKERREICGKTVHFVDQAPLRAALSGRLLLLEDVHKAERNVLPTLNNLLENREMNLVSGRRLVHPDSFASVAASASETKHSSILPCHKNFRVVALGCPVPQFPGYPLDPPFRSRFQCRVVEDPLLLLTALEALETMQVDLPDELQRVFVDLFDQMPRPQRPMSIAESTAAEAVCDADLAHGAGTCYAAAESVREILRAFPNTTKSATAVQRLFASCYPSQALLPQQVARLPESWKVTADPVRLKPLSLQQTIDELEESIRCARSTCVIGPRGCGKTRAVSAALKGCRKSFVVFHCFKDMGMQDLFQRRVLDSEGNSTWQNSVLINAAVMGHCVVLDGLHRAPPGLIDALSSLVHDAAVVLPDGTRLVPSGASVSSDSRMLEVHPDFFIIALSEPTSLTFPWLSTGVMSLFRRFLSVAAPSPREVVVSRHGRCCDAPSGTFQWTDAELDALQQLIQNLEGLTPVSTRTIHRLLDAADRHVGAGSDHRQEIVSVLRRSLMIDFLPTAVRKNCEQVLSSYARSDVNPSDHDVPDIVVDEERHELRIGDIVIQRQDRSITDPSMVPHMTTFVPIPSHRKVLQSIAFELAEADKKRQQAHRSGGHVEPVNASFLLIGNQGTGKNKLCDAFLGMLWREREYMQLNRDTTVQSLTLTPSVEGGAMSWTLSPLLLAAQSGRIAVIDEADKAPLEAVCVLKALLWDGHLSLPDGRCVRRAHDGETIGQDPSVIYIHPNFVCFVLANRPGLPFLGNDFFRECGDVLSTYAVHNPDLSSELQLLRAYAPDVSQHTLTQLCTAFEKLRGLVDKGELQYPFSTREVVNIARHMQAYPNESVGSALRNAMDFDGYTPHVSKLVKRQLEESGLVLERGAISLAPTVECANESIHETFVIGGDYHASTMVFHEANPTFPAVCRDVSNEVVHDMRPVSIHMFTNPRSYQFTNLRAEAQLSIKAAGTPGGLPSRHISSVIDIASTATQPSGEVETLLLVLAAEPQGLFIVPASCPETGPKESKDLVGRELDLSFVGGHVSAVVSIEPHVAAIVSVELHAVHFLTLSTEASGNRMFQVMIPALLYHGPKPELKDTPMWSRVHELTDGVVCGAQSVGKRFVGAESYVTCTKSVASDACTHLTFVNHRLGLGLVVSWSPRGTESEWRPNVAFRWFRATAHLPFASTTAHVHLDDTVQVAVETSQSTIAWLSSTEMPSATEHPSTVASDAVAQVAGSPKSVADLIRLSKSRSAATPTTKPPAALMTTSPTVTQAAQPRHLHFVRMSRWSQPSTVGRPSLGFTGCGRLLNVVAADTGTSCVVAVSERPLAACTDGIVSTRHFHIPVPNGGVCWSAAIIASSSQCVTRDVSVFAMSVLYRQSISLDNDPDVTSTLESPVREEIWWCRLTSSLGLTVTKVSRDVSWEHLRSSGKLRVHDAVYCKQLGPSAPLVAVSSDGLLEWYDVGNSDVATALAKWKQEAGTMHDDMPLALSEWSPTESLSPSEEASLGFTSPDDAAPGDVAGDGSTATDGDGDGDNVLGRGRGVGAGSGGSGGGGGGGGGGSGSGANLVGSGKGGFSQDSQGKLFATSSRRRTTEAKVVLSRSSGSSVYDNCLKRVDHEIVRVAAVLEAAEAREKERQWQSNQVQGELDDRRLVDAVIGEGNVYRRRGVPISPLGLPQRKPKYIDIVVDVSASMARFNAWDGRLDRLCESIVMILESAKNFVPHKFIIDIHGHSGASARTPFLLTSPKSSSITDAPTNEVLKDIIQSAAKKSVVPTSMATLPDRVRVIDSMVSHARTTTSGDGTMEGLRLALEHCRAIEQDVDEAFIVLISDANLGGYGITPHEIRKLLDDGGVTAVQNPLSSEPIGTTQVADSHATPVSVNLVFISEKEAADYLCKELPIGVGHHCPTTQDMPQVLRDIILRGAVSFS